MFCSPKQNLAILLLIVWTLSAAAQGSSSANTASKIDVLERNTNQRFDSLERASAAQTEITRAKVENMSALLQLQQKDVDWWLSLVGILLTLLTLVAAAAGIIVPWLLTQQRRNEYEQMIRGAREATDLARGAASLATEHAASAGRSAQQILERNPNVRESLGGSLARAEILEMERAADDPRLAEDNRLRATILKEQALGNWGKAAELAREFTKKYETSRNSYNGLGYSLQKLAQTRAGFERKKLLLEALDAYKKEAEREPTNALAWNNMGWALQDLAELETKSEQVQENLKQAAVAISRAVELNPAMVEAWNNRGWNLMLRARILDDINERKELLAEARGYLEMALRLNSKYTTASMNLNAVEALLK